MNKRKLTTIVMIVSLVILTAYDIWIYFDSEHDATISVVFWLWSQHNPVTALIAGFLMGHWFAPPYPRNEIK